MRRATHRRAQRGTRTVAGAFAAALALLAGCNFAPHYERPKTLEADAYKEAVPGGELAADVGHRPMG